MGSRSEDIGAVLDKAQLVTLSAGAGWNGAADINGTGIDRSTYDMPLSAVVTFEGSGTAADTARVKLQDSPDNSTWADVTDKDGNVVLLDLVIGTTDFASIDVKLTGADRYVRGVAVAANSTFSTTGNVVAQIIFGGAKVNG